MEIEYKVRFAYESKIPTSIVRKIVSDHTYVIESCNKWTSWEENPGLVSCWMG